MISGQADIEAGLAELLTIDPRLRHVATVAGRVPHRRTPGGLRGLAATIIGQQVSRASAEAIFGRFAAEVDLDDAAGLLAASDEVFRRAGLSRAKQRTMRAIAQAIADGHLDLARIERAAAPDAIAELVAIHGIGPWTAQSYLLFALGHRDVFPAGDLALQIAVAHGLGLSERPREKALAAMAELWSPARSVAALLFWSYYHAITRRDAAPALMAAAVTDGPVVAEP